VVVEVWKKQRHDLHQAADADDEDGQHDQQTEVLFNALMRNHVRSP